MTDNGEECEVLVALLGQSQVTQTGQHDLTVTGQTAKCKNNCQNIANNYTLSVT